MTNEQYDTAQNYWISKENDSNKLDNSEIINAYETYVNSNNMCALATGAGTFVRCTPIEYTYIDKVFYMFSEGGLKFKALKENKNVCLSIFDGYNGFNNIKGLQVTGTAELIEPFNDEYVMVVKYKKINIEAFKKMEHPMNLIKVTPTHIDFLNTDFKKLNGSSRQSIDF